jgi:hypothetical protein
MEVSLKLKELYILTICMSMMMMMYDDGDDGDDDGDDNSGGRPKSNRPFICCN